MRILDKYILVNFLTSLFCCLFVFVFLYVIVDLFCLLEDILKNKVPLIIIFRYYLAFLPRIFIQISPFSCLISIMYTLGKINYHNELIAMRVGGLSTFRISFPIILFGLIIVFINFIFSEKVVSENQRIADQIKSQYIEKKNFPAAAILTNLAIYGFQNRQLFINTFRTKENEIDGLTILEQDKKQNVISKLFAKKVIWKKDYWQAYECWRYNFDHQGSVIGSRYFENIKLEISEKPQDILTQVQKIEYMNSRELLDYILKLSNSSAEAAIRNLWVELYHKMVMPFTCIIMLFIGIPASFILSRKMVGFSSIGISIVGALMYFLIQTMSLALGKNGILPPLASALITPLIFLFISIYLIVFSL